MLASQSCKEPVGLPSDFDSFELHADFSIQLIAKEPVVVDPVDMAFGDSNKIFVLEMPGYPHSDQQSRIVQITDENADGQFDKRTVVADELRQATSFLLVDHFFLVAAPPYILKLTLDQSGTLSHIDTIFEGFSEGNLQHNINGLTYGLDNWIYGANGGNGGHIKLHGHNQSEGIRLGERDFRFKLDPPIFECTGRSSGGFEIAMNSWGHYFGTHNLYHIRHLVFPDRYFDGQYLMPRHTLAHISDHEEDGPARIFAIGEQHTRVNHPEQSGYFSGACGIEHYGGGLFSEDFDGNIFVADVVLNLIHRDIVSPDGATYQATRGRGQNEFLASEDRAFRPVNIKTGKDGALYIVDMYREVIEHPEWIPDELEAQMDLKAGSDQGRIFRIVSKHEKEIISCHLQSSNVNELLQSLTSVNQKCRSLAQSIIVQNKLYEAEQTLRGFLVSENSVTVVHALWTLEGLDKLQQDDVLFCLRHLDARVREQALRVCESFFEELVPEHEIVQLIQDQDARVRMQAMLTASVCLTMHEDLAPRIYPSIRTALISYESDPWVDMAAAAAFNLYPNLAFQQITKEASISGKVLQMVCLRLGQINHAPYLTEVFSSLPKLALSSPQLTDIIEGLSEGLRINGKALNRSDDVNLFLQRIEQRSDTLDLAIWRLRKDIGLPASTYQTSRARSAVMQIQNSEASTSARLSALATIGLGLAQQNVSLLLKLLGNQEPIELQLAAIEILGALKDPNIAQFLIEKWRELSPAVRRHARDILLYQESNQSILLDAMENGTLNVTEFNFDLERRRELLFSDDERIAARAKALFTDAGVVTRKDALTSMEGALSLDGSATRGSIVFNEHCAQCHTHKSRGKNVGPDLTECARMSKATLLHHILDPNAVAEPRYIEHIVELADNRILHGVIDAETSDGITIKILGGGVEEIARSNVKKIRSTGRSFMPEGLEADINAKDMADLIAFLQSN